MGWGGCRAGWQEFYLKKKKKEKKGKIKKIVMLLYFVNTTKLVQTWIYMKDVLKHFCSLFIFHVHYFYLMCSVHWCVLSSLIWWKSILRLTAAPRSWHQTAPSRDFRPPNWTGSVQKYFEISWLAIWSILSIRRFSAPFTSVGCHQIL